MAETCVGEPLSWLTLERHHLGETAGAERARVEAHLAGCGTCRAVLGVLEADPPRPLRPLPVAADVLRRPPWSLRWTFAAPAGALVGAVILLALVLAPPAAPEWNGPLPRVAVKGGERAVTVVRERAGAVVPDARTFAPGDRLKVALTCPPGERLAWDVVVFQTDGPAFPLRAGQWVACGNGVPLPGAFRPTLAAPAIVCVVAADAPPDRAVLADPAALPAGAVCAPLLPVSPARGR